MSKPDPKKRVVLGGAALATVIVLSLVKGSAIANPTRSLISGTLILGWVVFAGYSLYRRFGWPGVLPLALLISSAAAWLGYKYVDDIPHRRRVAEIEQLGPVRVITEGDWKGSVWKGDIQFLYFESDINETQVLKILDSPGLEKLERVVFKRTPITDATLARLARVPTLRDVFLQGGAITGEGIDRLRKAVPNCRVEIP